ncbi:hypothetical protein J6590_086954 [Homalodisca vitripennis]|nr:hypothetical protein J6590_086954 [Homalodisca vitripennis]
MAVLWFKVDQCFPLAHWSLYKVLGRPVRTADEQKKINLFTGKDCYSISCVVVSKVKGQQKFIYPRSSHVTSVAYAVSAPETSYNLISPHQSLNGVPAVYFC